MIPVTARMDAIQPFHVMAILARARQLEALGKHIVHMEIGEPDFDTPAPIVEAGIAALQSGKTHYTPALGIPELREALSRYYSEHYGLDVSAERIVITPGSSGALQLIAGVLFQPGREVLVPDPGYPCNRHFVTLMGATPVAIEVDEHTRFQPTPAMIAKSWRVGRTVAAMLASPANPTGTLVSPDDITAMAHFAAECDGYLVVDEIYHGLEFGERPASAASVGDNVFVINSFSKHFGMTGWRIGWLIAPVEWVPAIERLAQNIFLAPPTVAQYAALAAFSPKCLGELRRRRDIFKQRCEYLLPALSRLGFRIPVPPDGAFYLYADCSRFTQDSFKFCERLLEEANVAITPGADFGNFRDRHHVRFAFTQDIKELQEGVRRIEHFLSGCQ